MARTKTKPKPKYTAICDTREQKGWSFPESDQCLGTVSQCLKIADYSLLGFEDIFVAEKKGSVSEVYSNTVSADWKRFKAELEKLNEYKHAYVIFEFNVNDVINFPWSDPSIPRRVKYKLKVNGKDLLYRINKLTVDFPNIQFVFAGSGAKFYLEMLFKRMVSLYPERVPTDAAQNN